MYFLNNKSPYNNRKNDFKYIYLYIKLKGPVSQTGLSLSQD